MKLEPENNKDTNHQDCFTSSTHTSKAANFSTLSFICKCHICMILHCSPSRVWYFHLYVHIYIFTHLQYFALFIYIFYLNLDFVFSTAAGEDGCNAKFPCIVDSDNKVSCLTLFTEPSFFCMTSLLFHAFTAWCLFSVNSCMSKISFGINYASLSAVRVQLKQKCHYLKRLKISELSAIPVYHLIIYQH